LVGVAELEVLGRRQGGHLMVGQVLKRETVLKERGQMRMKEQGRLKRAIDLIGSNC